MIDREMNALGGMREDYDYTKRILKQEFLTSNGNEYYLSTVDLGIDYGFGDYTGVYWETMLFHKVDGIYSSLHMERYRSREDAEKGHEYIKERFIKGRLREEEEE